MSRNMSYLRISVLLALLISIIITKELWFAERAFPLIPFFESFPSLSNINVFYILIGLVVSNIILNHRLLLTLLLLVIPIVCALDQMRIQPWLYYYILVLCCLLFKDSRTSLLYLRCITITIYIWSGIHKININFIDHVFPDLFSSILSDTLISHSNLLAFGVPAIEIAIGIFLICSATRKIAVYLALFTHSLIIILIAPSNTVIIPWNICMMISLLLIFDGKETLINKSEILLRHAITLTIFFILPIFNYYNKLDHFLSFDMYSGKCDGLYIAISDSAEYMISDEQKKAIIPIENLEGGNILSANQWSMATLNVPIPPEGRIFQTIIDYFCTKGVSSEDIVFLVSKIPFDHRDTRTLECNFAAKK